MTRLLICLIAAALAAGLMLPGAGGTACAAGPARTAHAQRRIHLTSQKITLPFGDEVFAGTGKIAKAANTRCLLCHSREMVDYQPKLSLETWKKEVDKMRTTFGCPLRADQTDDLAAFVAQAAAAGN